MIEIKEITNLKQIYNYQQKFESPYFFKTDFATWKNSFIADIDGNGNTLFKKLVVKAAFKNNKLIGFIQYGISAFGFDNNGNISTNINYSIIRNLYFDKNQPDAGKLLLQESLNFFESSATIYAFFHYFGMSCFARHGKLFEKYEYIKNLLIETGFKVEHQNVYYSSVIKTQEPTNATIIEHNLSAGQQQYIDFIIDNKQVGGCEIHFVNNNIAYLRWIYVNNDITNQGIGSKCMSSLTNWLFTKGYLQLDTDTAVSNKIAQHFYSKNNFICKGNTTSFYKNK